LNPRLPVFQPELNPGKPGEQTREPWVKKTRPTFFFLVEIPYICTNQIPNIMSIKKSKKPPITVPNFVFVSVLVIVFLTLALSIFRTELKTGVVIDKWYEEGVHEEYSYFTPPPVKKEITETRWDDEDYVLIVRGFNGRDTIQQRFEVTKEDYENVNIGDTFTPRKHLH